MEWHRYFGPFKTFLHQLFNNFNKTLIKSPYVFVIIVDTVIALQGRNSNPNPNPLYSKSKGMNNIVGAHRYGSSEKNTYHLRSYCPDQTPKGKFSAKDYI